MPLEFMLSVVRDPTIAYDVRLSAAKSAAQFCHPSLKAIEHSGPDGGPIQVEKLLTIDFE